MSTTISTILVAAWLLLGVFAVGSGGTAHAQGCLSSGDARAAVNEGRALPLSSLLNQIRSTAGGGEILPSPKLCNAGNRLVYRVNVLDPGGKVVRLTVDASSGRIIGN